VPVHVVSAPSVRTATSRGDLQGQSSRESTVARPAITTKISSPRCRCHARRHLPDDGLTGVAESDRRPRTRGHRDDLRRVQLGWLLASLGKGRRTEGSGRRFSGMFGSVVASRDGGEKPNVSRIGYYDTCGGKADGRRGHRRHRGNEETNAGGTRTPGTRYGGTGSGGNRRNEGDLVEVRCSDRVDRPRSPPPPPASPSRPEGRPAVCYAQVLVDVELRPPRPRLLDTSSGRARRPRRSPAAGSAAASRAGRRLVRSSGRSAESPFEGLRVARR